jgi:hypothetical protein
VGKKAIRRLAGTAVTAAKTSTPVPNLSQHNARAKRGFFDHSAKTSALLMHMLHGSIVDTRIVQAQHWHTFRGDGRTRSFNEQQKLEAKSHGLRKQ